MSVVDRAGHIVNDLVGSVLPAGARRHRPQTMTIARPRSEVERFWRDPESLSRVLGEFGEVRPNHPGGVEWVLDPDSEDPVVWRSDLVVESASIRFFGPGDDGSAPVTISFADAPGDLGTEVKIEFTGPVPEIMSRAMAFKALYRARALMQTGEIPTIRHNPSARESAR
ncbi:hypothetical protein [Rhodococcus chondri]|uniref:Cyclase n=1 Tax=Rhodococcus chondri TaxID=3065941 RepID=A0ABU7JMS8_9NOCA|nr:hypothetical protein [Rhodococcus sp. CC-R104]MEE2031179.1 hypothetical protein [Rhodococcus sp. CC-R104]